MTDPVDLDRRARPLPLGHARGRRRRSTLLDRMLAAAGFRVRRADRNGIANLYARWGTRRPGPRLQRPHRRRARPATRPPGATTPSPAIIADGRLWGRGAADMKSGVAAFAAAAIDFVAATPPAGSVVLAITGDEEGASIDGTVAILDWMAANGERHRPLPRRRADLPDAHGRDDQDRPPRLADRAS